MRTPATPLSEIQSTKRQWCGIEWRAISELITPERSQTLMLVRFDKTEIPRVTSNDGYLDAESLRAEDVADVIVRKLTLNRQADLHHTP
jgi:hypothetical protein